ncbi:FISUMP domain-containing protein [Dysgonomonas sp.]
MNKIKLTIILTLFTSLHTAVYGQLTIGSGKDPMKGALLDLKEYDEATGGVTARRGMMLPRVNLDKLKPTTPSDLAKSIGSSETWDLNAHIGLTVYNVKTPDQCASEQIPVGVYTWTGTEWVHLGQSAGEILAPGVIYHEAKKNPDYVDETTTPGKPVYIYEGFYSAWFGDLNHIDEPGYGSRWMTTNLAAWAYDGNRHSTDPDPKNPATSGLGDKRTLGTLPNANSGHPYNTAYWCYPMKMGGDGTSDEVYKANPHLGLLYTWDAATAGKGGPTGLDNTTDEGANNTYPLVQGICPAGWHLPSDWEWTELENAIIQYTSSYANMPDIILNPDGELLLQDNSETWYRGTHGQAMKEICGINGASTKGLSNRISDGGFSVRLVGYAYGGGNTGLFTYGYFWSSSSDGGTSITDSGAWSRHLYLYYDTVRRFNSNRRNLFSVRCKKD